MAGKSILQQMKHWPELTVGDIGYYIIIAIATSREACLFYESYLVPAPA